MLARFDKPFVMLAARQSQLWSCGHAAAAVADNPQGRAVIVDDCGHTVPFDQPDRFVEDAPRLLGDTDAGGMTARPQRRALPAADVITNPALDAALQPRRGGVGAVRDAGWPSYDRPLRRRPRRSCDGASSTGCRCAARRRDRAVRRCERHRRRGDHQLRADGRDPADRSGRTARGRAARGDQRRPAGRAAAEQGLWYPPDPASSPWSTIGGNVATNAGGVCCVKYGVTRDYVLGLEVVTGTGELVRLGRQTAKGVAGYDLAGLMVGSEGTLGLVTEVTVRLRPARPPEHTVVGFFDTLVAAGEAVAAVARAGVVPSALELLDRHCLTAVNDWKNLGLEADSAAILLARLDAPGAAGDAEADAVLGCFECRRCDVGRLVPPTPRRPTRCSQLADWPIPPWSGWVRCCTEDVCVPITQVPAMLARIEEIGARHDVLIANIAHAGDGNLHPLLITPPGDDAARIRAQQAFEEILTEALAVGGTVTGRARRRPAQAGTAWRARSHRPWPSCTAPSGAPWIRTASSTPAR